MNTRRLRLLRELELAVGELEADGFAKTNGDAMAPLRAQLKESYAAAPPEFVDEARKSTRSFGDADEEAGALLYNYKPVGSTSYQAYLFAPRQSQFQV